MNRSARWSRLPAVSSSTPPLPLTPPLKTRARINLQQIGAAADCEVHGVARAGDGSSIFNSAGHAKINAVLSTHGAMVDDVGGARRDIDGGGAIAPTGRRLYHGAGIIYDAAASKQAGAVIERRYDLPAVVDSPSRAIDKDPVLPAGDVASAGIAYGPARFQIQAVTAGAAIPGNRAGIDDAAAGALERNAITFG